jgi:adenosylhomocysteine nucleosidase
VETGIGPARATAAAEAAPAAARFLVFGCAGGLAPRLAPGHLVAAEALVTLDADGRPGERLEADAGLAAWTGPRGVPVIVGTIATSPVALVTPAAKRAAAACGAVAVDMESAAIAMVARARGIPFTALRAIIDTAADDLTLGAELVDPATGRLRIGRIVARLAPRPWLWPRAVELARRQQACERALAAVATLALGAGGRGVFEERDVPRALAR